MTTYTTTTITDDGQRLTRTYYVRGDRLGYVFFTDARGEAQQVCERLQARGSTLMATPETLRATIQRHARLARYDEGTR